MIPTDYLNQIVTGDARILAERIPDASVDLIFTDPVYDRIEDYAWLAETAARVLKPDSACLVFCSKRYQSRCQALMESALDFVYTLDYIVQGKSYMLNTYRLFLWNTPCLLFQKGRCAPRGWIPDCAIIHFGQMARTQHKWSKDPSVVTKWLTNYCDHDAVVFDPFVGGGTIPAVCRMTHRNYIAFEIDPDTAERARARVVSTQAMHPVFLEEQTAMQVAV